MHLSDLFKKELAGFRERTGRTALNILETGTIRNEGQQYQQNDGWSTVTLAEDVRDNGGSLTSVDLSVAASNNVLSSLHLREFVTLVEGYSVDVLAGMLDYEKQFRLVFDVILLDSDNDSNLILHEFMIAKHLLSPGGIIFVDDVNLSSPHVFKGDKIVPWLDQNNISYRTLHRTGTTYATDMLAIEI